MNLIPTNAFDEQDLGYSIVQNLIQPSSTVDLKDSMVSNDELSF